MNLENIRKLLGTAKGVVAYIGLDKNGKVLTQHKGTLSDGFNNVEFSTWVLNYIHAIDTYYPESGSSFLRFGTLTLYLCYDGQNSFAVVLNHEANLSEFEQDFSALWANSNGAKPRAAQSQVEETVKRGETVFLKISDTAPSSTPVPVKRTVGLAGEKKESKSPLGLIIGVVAVLVVVIGIAVVALGGKGDDAAETTVAIPASNAPAAQPTAPDPVDHAALAEEAEAAFMQLKALAEDRRGPEVGRALASTQVAERNAAAAAQAQNWEDAANIWQEAHGLLGRALIAGAEQLLQDELRAQGLGELVQEAPHLLTPVNHARQAVAQALEQGTYQDALQALDEAVSKLPEVREAALEQILQMAAQAAEQGDPDTALFFYLQAHRIDAAHPQVLDYLYHHQFDAGELVEGPFDLTFAYVPPGTFTMGSNADLDPYHEPDEIRHEVTLTKGFFISTTEVTQAQWQQVMQRPIEMESPDPLMLGPNLPAHSITWAEAVEFCKRLSEMEGVTYRLPTEAEWEYACRAGTDEPFSLPHSETGVFGVTDLSFRQANIYNPTRDIAVVAVGTSGPANAWGLFDVHGNVSEWCLDWRAAYPEGPVTDPRGPADSEIDDVNVASKIIRGGSFVDEFQLARSSNRLEKNPAVTNDYIGFRVVREVNTFVDLELE